MPVPTETLYPHARSRPSYVWLLRPILKRFYGLWASILHAPDRRRREHLGGLTLDIDPGVFNPVTFLTSPLLLSMIDAVPIPPGARCLELGTGSGFAAIYAAKRGAEVLAVDLNERAITCGAENAARNGVASQVRFLHGDLFAPTLGERFDVVIFHPPYFPGPQEGHFGQAWCYGDLPTRFAAELGAHLRLGGAALLLLSTNGDCAAYLHALEAKGYGIEILVERELVVELAIGYRITPKGPA